MEWKSCVSLFLSKRAAQHNVLCGEIARSVPYTGETCKPTLFYMWLLQCTYSMNNNICALAFFGSIQFILRMSPEHTSIL